MSEIVVPMGSEELTLDQALYQVCRISNANNRMVKGIRQVSKKLLDSNLKLVLLSNEIDERSANIIISLAKKTNIPLIKVDDSITLGRYAGFEKRTISDEIKVAKCGCAGIVDYVQPSQGQVFLMNAIKQG
ncbi:40S ribosomal protein S12 [Spraguea lophii 42_110]|uniref:40S ribosomal protein S12 n=1 Tax=Spraguea lophii (strain 42_110) TaxID=1358809 RepID=S7W7D2_SPRLO|nr:Chain SM0, 40S ribosomal protein S12 [Spraguea lophii 42_110]7QJH_RM0 Chain RM0, 40S ribosomal protein S12 [Spraguea lophii 42_110]7QJH_SM0 Chain SM0, 40S ribosomal protein S12 [Spraguea lophii 42_110]8BR3_SM0 Chain SM0, 40S ribosomal protein S12 [Spraguea lophii 42_110]8P5D_SM0 Chain SM0, 40S ribosomal protein S12 [Spraguea lophii 42_110]8P60_RM0 Chain RM0, 40S ribosomal protein S12 [Spraguea lophii 42_110]8P60_SM0 Chain SM0, 40S ribosomal protein S12 [Spraguea lophii 42_110]EPR78740.1 4